MTITMNPFCSAVVAAHAFVLAFAALIGESQPADAQFTQQGNKFLSSGFTGGQPNQGFSVSLSGDGNTALIGAPFDNGGVGSARIFSRSDGVYTQVTSLTAPGTGPAEQGYSVALSSDGNTGILGGPHFNNDGGAAWIFVRNGDNWSQQSGTLTGSNVVGPGAFQGASVALSADGNTAIVGGPSDTPSGGSSIGAAWVYTRSGTTWTEQVKLVGSNSFDSQQGRLVALSADGNTAAVGGQHDNNGIGAVWVFTRSGSAWTEQAKLVGTDFVGTPAQGTSLALSADGNTLAVGGPSDNSGLFGAVYIFTRSGSTWTQQGRKLTPQGNNGITDFGSSVSVSHDGSLLLVGGPRDASSAGASWVFTRIAGTWTQLGSKLVGTGAIGAARQGSGVALSSDGTTAVVGGNQDNSGIGAAWAFTQPPSTLLAAVLPASRSSTIGSGATGTVTAFATIINTGTATATDCGIAPNANLPAMFVFQTTDPRTNFLTGTANAGAAIPGNNGSQSYVVAFTPTAPIAPTNVPFSFSCSNATPAPSVTGINTLLLSGSTAPAPDVVALAATLQNDGIVHVTNGSPATGVFAVATSNLGFPDSITVGANTGSAFLPLAITVCQTDPVSGTCMQTPAPTATTTMVTNATRTFGIFVSASGNVPFDPTNNRIFVTFSDSTNTVRGETSVAVVTR